MTEASSSPRSAEKIEAKFAPRGPAAGTWRTLGRHQIGAFAATAVDFGTMVLLVQCGGLTPSLGTAVSASVGAVTNFAIARRWIFLRQRGSAPAQGVRYAVVSAASALWNALGEHLLHDMAHVQYILARTMVSLAVGLAWNFPLHRYFVFREPVQA